MAKLLKLRRGTTSQHSSFTGAEGEVTVDTDKETLVVHDGSTAGGHPVAAEDMANVSSVSIAGRLATDSIGTTKIAAGALPTDVTVADANISGNLTIESADIVDGTIVNADINASAAIAGTKISPNFGTQNISSGSITTSGALNIQSNDPSIYFTEGDANPDYQVLSNGGVFKVHDATNSADRILINTDGHVDVNGNLDCGAGVDVTGNITVSGTVDGRDVAADGTKLDGVESGATADQTAAEIKTLVGNATDCNVFTDADHAKLDALTTSNGVILNGVTATTQSASDNSTKVATTAYADTAVSNLVDSSPAALNTLNELAAAIGDDANFSTTVTNNIATKMPLAGGEFTGDVTCHNITPDGDSSRNLGTNSVRFANIYGDTLYGDGSNLTGIQGIPTGVIMLWSGASNAIPSGFVICDGNNSTPDLRNRFLVGAGDTYSVGATGGANTASDTASITVSISGSGNTGGPSASTPKATHNNMSQVGTNNHTHSFNFSGSGSGSDTITVDTRSPYYALCYIMKT